MILLRALPILLVLCTAPSAAFAAEEPQRRAAAEWIELTKATQLAQCVRYTFAYETALKRDDVASSANAKAGMGIACECMPRGIASRAGEMSAGERAEVMSFEEFRAMLAPVLNRCAATQFRAEMATRCVEDPEFVKGAADRDAYCACLSARLEALDDAAIVAASIDAYRNFQARVKALREGQPKRASGLLPPLLQDIDSACKLATR